MAMTLKNERRPGRLSSMTPRQQRFVEEYLIDLNGTQAAIRAGYSRRGSDVTAARLLRNARIQAEIQKAMQRRSERTEITQDRVLKKLALLGFANMQDYMRAGANGDPYLDFSKLSREQAAALVEVTIDDFTDGRGEDAREVRRVKFKLADKLGALHKIGQHLRMFVERREVTGEDGEPIRRELTTEDGELLREALDGLPKRAPKPREPRPH